MYMEVYIYIATIVLHALICDALNLGIIVDKWAERQEI